MSFWFLAVWSGACLLSGDLPLTWKWSSLFPIILNIAFAIPIEGSVS